MLFFVLSIINVLPKMIQTTNVFFTFETVLAPDEIFHFVPTVWRNGTTLS